MFWRRRRRTRRDEGEKDMPEPAEEQVEGGDDMDEMMGFIFANMKRTYDEYQQVSLEGIKNQQKYQEKVLSDAQQNDNARQNVALQALQNSVETANMVSKQAVRHSDIAIDRQWNIDEVAHLIASTSVFKDAIAASVAQQILSQEK